jgi:hypothetical protein
MLVALASFTSGDQHFHEIVVPCRPPPHQDWGRARTTGSRLARDDKELGPQLGESISYTENGLVKRPIRDTRALSEAGVRRKGAAPLSGAEEQNARAISAYALTPAYFF